MRKVIVIVFLMLGLGLAAPATNFTVSLDRNAMKLGEQATLSLTFEGGTPTVPPEPSVAGLQFVNAGTSQNVSVINGVMSSTVTVSYIVTPQQIGGFTIPPMSADIGGQHFTSRAIHLTVLKDQPPSAQEVNSGLEPAFMKLVVPAKQVYVGQTLTAELEIYLRDDVQNYGNLRLAETPLDGFTMGGKLSEGHRFRAQAGNRAYIVVPLTVQLNVVKTGKLSLGPFSASLVVVLPDNSRQNEDPFFRSFFNQGQQKQVSITTETVTIPSLALPDPKPANFSGAIGDFTMNVTVGPTNLTVGDPLTVHVQISGKGSLDSVSLPDQSALRDFKIFPPTAKTDVTDQLGLEGSKTFEQIVTPQNTDVHEWPEFAFSYFNPDDGTYHTLRQPAVPLAIHPAASVPSPVVAAAKTDSQANRAPQDILPIQESLGSLASVSTPLIVRPAFIAAQSLPVLAFLAALVWRKRTDRLANNPRLRRRLAVAELVRNGLTALRRFAAENKSDEFFALLFRLLQEQLGERLDCPATAITEAVVDERVSQLGASPALQEALREQFQLCNQARYAPVRGTSELNSVVSRFEKAINELQDLKR